MEDAFQRRLARSKGSGPSGVRLMPSDQDKSLLGRLWNLDCSVGEPGAIRPDEDLMTAEWLDRTRLLLPHEGAEEVSCLTT